MCILTVAQTLWCFFQARSISAKFTILFHDSIIIIGINVICACACLSNLYCSIQPKHKLPDYSHRIDLLFNFYDVCLSNLFWIKKFLKFTRQESRYVMNVFKVLSSSRIQKRFYMNYIIAK